MVIQDIWNRNSVEDANRNWINKSEACKNALILWNKNHFGNIQKNIIQTRKEIDKLNNKKVLDNSPNPSTDLEIYLDELLVRE